MKRRVRIKWLKLAAHVGSVIPLVWLIGSYFSGNLTFNPIQAATIRTGHYALTLLWLSLACSPLYILTGFSELLPLRRVLGLYAFGYAGLHLLIFVGWDYGFDWSLVLPLFARQYYLIAGLAALVLLFVLALTSFSLWIRWLGVFWKRLHRLVYLAAGLVVVHYLLVVDGSLWTLQGEIWKPLAYAAVLALLLALRLPPVRRAVICFRQGQQPAHGSTVEGQAG